MKSIIFTLISLSLCTHVLAEKKNSYYCHWRNNLNSLKSLSVDYKYSEKGRFYYYLSNDNDNIYVDLRISDNNVQRQVLRSGMTIWVDMDGKKARKTGIKYPAQNIQRSQNRSYEPGRQDRRSTRIPDENGSRSSGKMQKPVANTMELIELPGPGSVFISSNEPDNFRGSVDFDKKGNMWYELVMPISKLPALSHKNRNGDYSFILGFQYSRMNYFAPGGGHPGGGSFGGHGGHPGGGGGAWGGGGRGGMHPGGGGYPGRGYGFSPESGSETKTIVWLKNISLAGNK